MFTFKEYLESNQTHISDMLEVDGIEFTEPLFFESVETILEDLDLVNVRGTTPETKKPYITLSQKKDIGLVSRKEYNRERDEVAADWKKSSPKEKATKAKAAQEFLGRTHGIKGHTDLLKKNDKLDIPVGKIPSSHPFLGETHGGKEVIAIGVQRTPDKLKTANGYLQTCSRSTASCRDGNCLMKTGQNAVPTAIESKNRAETARQGLALNGDRAEDPSATRKAYHTLMLHGLESHAKIAARKGKHVSLRAGYAAEDGANDNSDINYLKGLHDSHKDMFIPTGYSGIPDANNERPHEAASIKGPAVKTTHDPHTGSQITSYRKEEHLHTNEMLSSMVPKKSEEEVTADIANGTHKTGSNPHVGKNGYMVTAAFRNANPMTNPTYNEQMKRMDTAHTVRWHHYDENGYTGRFTDIPVNRSGSEKHDLRAADPVSVKSKSKGTSGIGSMTIASFAGMPKGKSAKGVVDPHSGIKIPAHALNNEMTFPLPDHDGIIHVNHPDQVAKLPEDKKKEFFANDAKFRSSHVMETAKNM